MKHPPCASSPSTSSAKPRLAQLDGLRAVAICGVMLHHFGVKPGAWLDWGPVAPTVFFILSGFLITNSLVKMRTTGRMGWEGLTAFHIKRMARLLPALYLMILVGWFSGLPEYREGVGWHLSFMSSTQMALTGEWPGSLSQLWSLSIQEQFYMLWPLIFFLPLTWWPAAMSLVAVAAVAFRLACIRLGAPSMFEWFLLPGSLDSFAAGGLLALALRRFPAWKPGRWLTLLGGIAVAGLWVAGRALRHLEGSGSLWLALVETAEITLFSALLVLLATNSSHPLSKFLASRPLAALGKISYGLFIWHMLISTALGPHLDAAGLTLQSGVLMRTAILFSVSLLVAWLSWIAIEKPSISWAYAASEAMPRWFLAQSRRWYRRAVALATSARATGRESL